MLLYRDNMPRLDLHGENEVSAGIKIKTFIDEQMILENNEFAIIHGVGKQILKRKTHEVLKNDKRVLEYKLDNFNIGCTLVRLKKMVK